MKSKFNCVKSKKNKHKNNAVLKEKKEKKTLEMKNRNDVCYMTFRYLFTYFAHIVFKINTLPCTLLLLLHKYA